MTNDYHKGWRYKLAHDKNQTRRRSRAIRNRAERLCRAHPLGSPCLRCASRSRPLHSGALEVHLRTATGWMLHLRVRAFLTLASAATWALIARRNAMRAAAILAASAATTPAARSPDSSASSAADSAQITTPATTPGDSP